MSPDKAAVFREAHRVLRMGGRLAISDIVEVAPMPDELRGAVGALTGCIAGAASVESVRELLLAAGFEDVQVAPRPASRQFIRGWLPGSRAEEYVASAEISARKPAV